MTSLVPTTPSNLPTPPQPGIARAVSYLSNKLIPAGVGFELPTSEAPTEEQRRGLDRRLSRLGDWLAPFAAADEQSVRDELYALLSTRKGDTPVGDARAIVAIYVADLRDLPLHAIQAACLDFRQGRVPEDRGFRPPQADIRRQAQRHMHALALEERRIRSILDAKLVDRRSDAATRAEIAAAARRSFGIPEAGHTAGQRPHAPVEDADGLAAIGRRILERSSMDRWRADQAAREGLVSAADRFGEDAA